MFATRALGLRALGAAKAAGRVGGAAGAGAGPAGAVGALRGKSTMPHAAHYEPTERELTLSKEMTWTDFLAMRKQQRRVGTIGSAIAALGTMATAFAFVSNVQIDPTETFFGLDIFTCYIGGIMCTGFVGFMFGPALLGDPLFALLNRSKMGAFNVKQKLFLKHIQKMRVDASRQSMNNPVPDYYGEKIGSLSEYRQWLRDCNEYRRKAKAFL